MYLAEWSHKTEFDLFSLFVSCVSLSLFVVIQLKLVYLYDIRK
jgi:hypothetical protein